MQTVPRPLAPVWTDRPDVDDKLASYYVDALLTWGGKLESKILGIKDWADRVEE